MRSLPKLIAVYHLGAQVGWLRSLMGPPEGSVRHYLEYAGILDPVGSTTELALRHKCLLLVAVCLKQRSLRRANALLAICVCTARSLKMSLVEASVPIKGNR